LPFLNAPPPPLCKAWEEELCEGESDDDEDDEAEVDVEPRDAEEAAEEDVVGGVDEDEAFFAPEDDDDEVQLKGSIVSASSRLTRGSRVREKAALVAAPFRKSGRHAPSPSPLPPGPDLSLSEAAGRGGRLALLRV